MTKKLGVYALESSNQIWNHPRLLSTYKNEIVLSACITLDELDSVLLPDINSTLYALLILISPVEKLQKLVVNLLEPEIQQVTVLFHMNEMNVAFKR